MEETSNKNQESKSDEITIDLASGLTNFIIKTFIISISIVLSLTYLFSQIPKFEEKEKNKIILVSFIQNPAILMKLAINEENKGEKLKAIFYLEAAIGLMEMHGAKENYILKYQEKINELKSKN